MKHGVKLLKRRNFVCNLKRCTTKKRGRRKQRRWENRESGGRRRKRTRRTRTGEWARRM